MTIVQSLWQIVQRFLDDNDAIADFLADDDHSALIKFKTKIAGRIVDNGTKDVKMMLPLKYLSKF